MSKAIYRGYRLKKVDTQFGDDWYKVLATHVKSNRELGVFEDFKDAKAAINRALDGDRKLADGRRVWSC